LGVIAGMEDGANRPLFIPNYGSINQMPGGGSMWSNGTILGRPFIISENMPDVAQGDVSLYFADFNRLYFLLNRVGATVRVLDQPQYTAGNYIYALRARFGGRVVQPYAGRGLKHT
jgi:HK97 family phage major capsid protein